MVISDASRPGRDRRLAPFVLALVCLLLWGATGLAGGPRPRRPLPRKRPNRRIRPGKSSRPAWKPRFSGCPRAIPRGPFLAVLTLVSAPGWHAYAVGPAESGQSAQGLPACREQPGPATALFPPGTPDPGPPRSGQDRAGLRRENPDFRTPWPRRPGPAPPCRARSGSFPVPKRVAGRRPCPWPSPWPTTRPRTCRRPKARRGGRCFLALRNAALATPPVQLPRTDPVVGHPPPRGPWPRLPRAAPATAVPKLTPRSFTPALEVSGLLKAALLAFLAGLILNFMPCVLPVVSLKLSGLLAISGEEGRQERRRILREHNFFFALGIVVYFLGLSLLLGMFGMAWGEMFQSATLAIVVTVVLFALSLSLFGVFHLPVVDLKISSGGRGHTRRGAFLTGVLTTLLATPCSGPFLGGVLAWTLLQPLPVVMTVFASIGLGMASPYGVLAIWPRLVRFLPRPGAWMQVLEKGMAFILAATCLYFLALLPPPRLLPTLAALWAAAVGATLYGRGAHLSQSVGRRFAMSLAAVAVAGAGLAFALAYAPPAEAQWETYSPEAFAARLGRENLVLDFTADWCPTCKLLERTVLTPARLTQWGERHKTVFMKVDLTRQTPPAMALLRALGSQSIPVAAFFPAGDGAQSPLVLRDLFTASQFEQAMAEALRPHGRPPHGQRPVGRLTAAS